jgi:hypothetical protein
LARSLNDFGLELMTMDKQGEAFAAWKEAAELFNALAEKHDAKRPHYLVMRASTLINYGAFAKGLDAKAEDWNSAFNQVTLIHSRLVKENRGLYSAEMAGSFMQLATVNFIQGRTREAAEKLDFAIDLVERSAKLGDEAYGYLPAFYAAKCTIHGSMNQHKQGLEAALRGLRHARALAARSPAQFEPQIAPLLAQAADFYSALGREREAQEARREAQQIRTKYRMS